MTKKFNLTDFYEDNECNILVALGRRVEFVCKDRCEIGSGEDMYCYIERNHYTFDPIEKVELRENETAYQFFKRLKENKIKIVPC